jgi:type VI secretion system protein ImpF
MAPPKPQEILRGSVFDRLSSSHRTRTADGEVGLREIHDAVMRDLERLLNTRVWWPGGLEGFEEAGDSLLTYGIPDLSAFSWTSVTDGKTVMKLVEDAIKTFEPRLLGRSVKVIAIERESIADFSLKMRIDAILQVDPYTERVSFDTELDAETGSMRLSGSL